MSYPGFGKPGYDGWPIFIAGGEHTGMIHERLPWDQSFQLSASNLQPSNRIDIYDHSTNLHPFPGRIQFIEAPETALPKNGSCL